MTDTIFALSSGPPPAGVAVVRVSGGGARTVVSRLTDSVPEPRKASLRDLKTAEGELIDRALVTFFPGPRSFTGEDVAEFHVHGGRAVIALLLRVIGGMPRVRLAEAGEFTRRAFLNKRLDLNQVEGLADLVRAETEIQRRSAMRQVAGGLSALCEGWRDRLLGARALVEAGFDFSDEGDVGDEIEKIAWTEVQRLSDEVERFLACATAERIRDAFEVVIMGPPNAGKSSLLNALAGRDVAIVTPEAGTTRDILEVQLDLDGYPVTVVDTAGLRSSDSIVEREGVRRAKARGEGADLVIWLQDLTAGLVEPPIGLGPLLRVGNKMDLIDSGRERQSFYPGFDLRISSTSGQGLADLLASLASQAKRLFEPGEGALVTRERQRLALADYGATLARSLVEPAAELRAEELRRATDALGRVSGRVGVEDLLDVIFREFCIGK